MIPVSVGFFDDMYIPLAYLPQPCALYALRFSFLIIVFFYLTVRRSQ